MEAPTPAESDFSNDDTLQLDGQPDSPEYTNIPEDTTRDDGNIEGLTMGKAACLDRALRFRVSVFQVESSVRSSSSLKRKTAGVIPAGSESGRQSRRNCLPNSRGSLSPHLRRCCASVGSIELPFAPGPDAANLRLRSASERPTGTRAMRRVLSGN